MPEFPVARHLASVDINATVSKGTRTRLRVAGLNWLGAAWVPLVLMAGCATAPSPLPLATEPLTRSNPEAATNLAATPAASAAKPARSMAVASANPLASQAGFDMLQRGGSALDAAIATQLVLALVEPQSSGPGGGAFLLHFDGKVVEAFDGRETAPMAVTPALFLGADGQPIPFTQAVVGGRAVGVPGVLRMLEMAHRQHGKLTWATLFEPAIRLAYQGFAVGPRLHSLLQADPYLRLDPQARAYFYQADGNALPVGHVLRNPALAQVLREVASHGAQAFYSGPIAQAMVDKVRGHATNPGSLALGDLSSYTAKKRQPICQPYTSSQERRYTVCGMGPPSSGGIAVGQILGILANTPAHTLPAKQAAAQGLASAPWLHLYTEASRLAFADRSLYLGDPDFVPPPAGSWMSLLEPAYLAARARLIQHGPGAQSMKVAQPGQPRGATTGFAPMPAQIEYGTSHLSVVDAQGNAVAMTTSIESAFGARQMVTAQAGLAGGFLLNNELTDFSFAPADAQGRPIANRVQPGKRPLSSMSPTLVLDESGRLVMTLGGAGGPFIIRQTSGMLHALLNWQMDPQHAAGLPHATSFNGPTLLEKGRFDAGTIAALQGMGHSVAEMDIPSGIHAIVRSRDGQPGGWLGAADPRREGTVVGD